MHRSDSGMADMTDCMIDMSERSIIAWEQNSRMKFQSQCQRCRVPPESLWDIQYAPQCDCHIPTFAREDEEPGVSPGSIRAPLLLLLSTHQVFFPHPSFWQRASLHIVSSKCRRDYSKKMRYRIGLSLSVRRRTRRREEIRAMTTATVLKRP